MCGLAGVVRFGASPLDPSLAGRFDVALAHRGPDGHGSYRSADGSVLLVHRRLAIIDPSHASDQPMADPSGRWHLVFNGEVYNYRDLRGELSREGVAFATGGDTEVLLQWLVHRGPSALAAVRGMFALALWDAHDRSLVVARDRFGIKPLYLARQPHSVAFASELSALRAAGCLSASDVRPSAVLSFLRWGSVVPPLTCFEGVEALDPGTWRRFATAGEESSGSFACLTWQGDETRPRTSAVAFEREVSDAIRDSVRAHLVSDVPVGLFLSGGLDSATLLAAAHDVGQPLECFTVADTAHPDEASAAEAIARAFGARWRPLRVDADAVRGAIPRAVARLDQPSIDGPNSWVVAGAAAREGLKTALSGCGADELFGGYPSSRLLPLWERLGALASPAAKGVGTLERVRRRPTRAERLEHVAKTRGLREHYRAVRGFFMPNELAGILGPRLSGAAGEGAVEDVDRLEARLLADRAEPITASVARAETEIYLRSQLLRDLDVMSMAHGLEVRVPFVDHVLLCTVWPRLADYPALLSRKNLLRRMLADRVPARVLKRRKTGFTLPFDAWMRHDLRSFARDGIAVAEREGWIANGQGDRVWREWEGGLQHWSRPWGLAVLGHHLQA